MSDDFFAPPPFRADEALLKLKQDLRALGLTEREGVFESRGRPLVRAHAEAGVLQAAVVREPARRPDWQPRTLSHSGDVRDFLSDLKKRLARWNEPDE